MRQALFLLLLSALSLVMPSAAAGDNTVLVITIDEDIISPVVAEYISRAIARAEEEGAECLVIQLDTPGGLVASTRRIVKAELNAEVPVVVYVAPSGARAGSAGVFITLAANIAAMAPSTNIGAAHPVEIGGGEDGESWRKALEELQQKLKELEKRQEGPSEEKPDDQQAGDQPQREEADEVEPTGTVMGDKVLRDTVAWMRAIARTRDRNEEWAVKAVTQSVSVTETEALAENVIDYISKDIETLLSEIDGVEVTTAAGARVLQTKEAEIRYVNMTTRQRVLNAISNPNVAYILMMLGFFGLLFEVTHPGVGFPGIAGAICLILAFYSFQALPINYAGFLLILLAMVLFIAEVKVTSYGLLTIGGLICMTLGSLMLIDSSYEFLRISLAVILPMVLTTAAIFIFLVTLVIRVHARKSVVGREGLIGEVGIAETDIATAGKIFVHGEIWNARSSRPISKGNKVRVVELDGMTATVESIDQ
ncbi:MAG: nodulation protein NfeD [Candidatus Abyssobacteria bacterium SURF_5]|uniref:Nodulation protein NfeD n=1 Tax=Abyssobacteria bacterium (strain SURF_5) TaxID=2093360 RepID=A0A3A4NII9_ABYX5|nr:MAG: nodulation protein NfeD [Candidatus Abyssubacteria bacterium SURF_5]